MGEDFIEKEFGVPAANARRNGERLFELLAPKVSSFGFRVSSSDSKTSHNENSEQKAIEVEGLLV
jgi:hypothetical protein